MKKIKEFPKVIKVKVKNSVGQEVTLNLEKEEDQKELSGLSQKVCYKNVETGAIYFVKSQKPRKIADIFGLDSPVTRAINQNIAIGRKVDFIFDEYTGQFFKKSLTGSQDVEIDEKEILRGLETLEGDDDKSLFLNNQKIIQAAAKHVHEVLIERAFLEALSPQIVKAMMGDSFCVPENIFYITKDGEPLNLSQSLFKSPQELEKLKDSDTIIKFVEPLAKKSVVGGKKKPDDWEGHKAPSIEDLKLSPEDGYILGQLYFVALLIGHWDLFNNIDLSNSGYVEYASGKKLAAIVDHGNDFFTGFSGLTKEESFILNPDKRPDFKDFKTETNLKKQITGFQFTEIFDDYVALLELPRSLVGDLFNLTETTLNPDRRKFRQAQLSGFKYACDAACKLAGEDLIKISSAIPQTIEKMFDQYMSADDANLVKGIINKEIYHLSSPKTEDAYTFANIMRGRLESLIEIQLQMKKNSVSEISGQRFRFMLDSQYKPSSTSAREQIQKRDQDTILQY